MNKDFMDDKKFGGNNTPADRFGASPSVSDADLARQYKDRSFDPIKSTMMRRVPVSMILPAVHNPRQTENPQIRNIKASIMSDGLMQPLRITRLPLSENRDNANKFHLMGSGNTRLRCLTELAQEFPEKFSHTDAIFVPYNSEYAKISAVMENVTVGAMSPYDYAVALLELADELCPYNKAGKRTRAQQAEWLTSKGVRVSRNKMYNMIFLVELNLSESIKPYMHLRTPDGLKEYIRATRVACGHFKLNIKIENVQSLAVEKFNSYYEQKYPKIQSQFDSDNVQNKEDFHTYMVSWVRQNFTKITKSAAHSTVLELVNNAEMDEKQRADFVKIMCIAQEQTNQIGIESIIHSVVKDTADKTGDSAPPGAKPDTADKTGDSAPPGAKPDTADKTGDSAPPGAKPDTADKTGDSAPPGAKPDTADKTGDSAPPGAKPDTADKTGDSAPPGAKPDTADKTGDSAPPGAKPDTADKTGDSAPPGAKPDTADKTGDSAPPGAKPNAAEEVGAAMAQAIKKHRSSQTPDAAELAILDCVVAVAQSVGLPPEIVLADNTAPLGFIMGVKYPNDTDLILTQKKPMRHIMWWVLHEISRAPTHQKDEQFPKLSPWKELDDVLYSELESNLGERPDLSLFHFRALPAMTKETIEAYANLMTAIAKAK